MHVLILNQTFYPDTAATARLMWDLARDLDGAGHRVSVVTSRVAYGTRGLHDRRWQLHGKGIEVRRVGGTRFGKGSRLGMVGRLCDFASFYLAAARELWSGETPDVILALTSPPMVAGLAVALKGYRQALGARAPAVVYHVMDLYPDAAEASGALRAGGLASRVLARLTAYTVAGADVTIVLGRDMRDRVLARYGGRDGGRGDGRRRDGGRQADDVARRMHVVTPWADGELLYPIPKRENPLARSLGLGGSFNVMYSGNLGAAHDLETIIRAVELTREWEGLCWLFVGDGSGFGPLRAAAARQGWSHVRILPFQPLEALNASLNLGDVHLVSQLASFTGVVVPSKLFGIMAVGRPAVMVGPPECECARILRQHEAGEVVANGDAPGLVDAIARMRRDDEYRARLGGSARTLFEAHYSRPIATTRIEAILRSAVAGAPG